MRWQRGICAALLVVVAGTGAVYADAAPRARAPLTNRAAECPFAGSGGTSVLFFAPVGHVNLMNGLFGDPVRGTPAHLGGCVDVHIAEPCNPGSPRPAEGDDPSINPTYPPRGSDVHRLAAERGVAGRVHVLHELALKMWVCEGAARYWWCTTPIPERQPYAGRTIEELAATSAACSSACGSATCRPRSSPPVTRGR
jgi:hypothetical protein